MGLAACFRAGTLRGYLLHSGLPSGSTPSPHITKPSIGAQHHRTCASPHADLPVETLIYRLFNETSYCFLYRTVAQVATK